MRIIHLTDYHYNEKNLANQSNFVDEVINQLKNLSEIDFLFFTGDLVDKGGNSGKYFAPAYNSLITRIIEADIINRENFFICCGNHDVNRGNEIAAIKTHIDALNSTDALNNFVASDDRQFKSSLDNIKNYLKIQKMFYDGSKDIIRELYTLHKREIKGKRIGIASINTAWRSFDSAKDKGNLLFPPAYIQDIIYHLKDEEIKIIIMHHPLTDLKDFNFFEIENNIFNNFQFMFSGHTHLDKIETQITGDEGIFCCVSPSTLTYTNGDNKIGFTIIDIDDENFYEAIVTRCIYDKRSSLFSNLPPISVQIPLNQEKQEIIKLKSNIRGKILLETENANELFLSNGDNGNGGKSFLQLFTTPALKTKSKAETTSTTDTHSIIELATLIDTNNYIIYGKSKSGRTSILYKLLLDILKGFPTVKVLPIYFDCRELKGEWDFISKVSKYYNLSRRKVEELLKIYHIKLLIDNYTSDMEDYTAILTKAIHTYNISLIICTDEVVSRSYESKFPINMQYNSLYIHDISRKNIRNLVKKWPKTAGQSEEVILNKINKIFSQLNISWNYWTVSLFLWVFEKTSNITLNNNVELIQLYVDELLDKSNLATYRRYRIRFEELKEYLGELAYFLLRNFGDKLYSASYTEIINFTNEYRDNNVRFVIEVEDIVNFIIEKSIIKKTYNDRYTFRLNGIFEYFLAFYMAQNDEYRKNILDSNIYLSFENELELYAGFKSKDRDFVNIIFERTKTIFSVKNEKYGSSTLIDSILLSNLSGNRYLHKAEKYDSELSALSPEAQDEIMDELQPLYLTNEEVKVKNYYETIEPNIENLEKSLKILSRVFRNSSIDDAELSRSILDYILLSICHLGFTILDEVKEDTSSNDTFQNEKNNHKTLMVLMERFMPLIINTILVDALAQENLERLILEKINSLKVDNKNQFQLMLLYFLLIDLNPIRGFQYIEDLIDNVNIGTLRLTILLKLYSYYIYLSHNNKKFEINLKSLIRKLRLLIDPKSKEKIDKDLNMLDKKMLIEHHST